MIHFFDHVPPYQKWIPIPLIGSGSRSKAPFCCAREGGSAGGINMPSKSTTLSKAELFILFIFIVILSTFIQTANAENMVLKAPCIFEKESGACVPAREIKNQAIYQRRQERCNQKIVICLEKNLCICANKDVYKMMKRIFI